jgi:hypothetical protein
MGHVTAREVVGFFYSGTDRLGRRPDFVAAKPDGGFRMWGVSIVDPCASSFVDFAARHDLGASRKRDATKRAKYDDVDDPAGCSNMGHTFIPLALETTGAFGPSMQAWFQSYIGSLREKELAEGGTGWEATATSIYWQQRIATSLHRSIGIRMAARMHVHVL